MAAKVTVVFSDNGQEWQAELPEKTVRALRLIAVRNNLSLAGAIQQAIIDESWLQDQEAAGARLLIKKGKRIRYLDRGASSDPVPAARRVLRRDLHYYLCDQGIVLATRERGKQIADHLRWLCSESDCKSLELDFVRVEAVSPPFLDEVLAAADDLFPGGYEVTNMNEDVETTVAFVRDRLLAR